MIKHINHQNFLTTPFVAAKNWRLYNVDSDDLVILEPTGSTDTVALEFVDYSTDSPFVNTECSIALEQQGNDRIVYQEGATGSGAFFPDSEPTNQDGTYKRLIHSEIKSTFYNKFNNPTQIFGMEYIDFPLGRTFRDLSDLVRIFTVPRNIFGERITENTVRLMDNSLDDNVEISDDGYQNLVAKANLFSKVQEVRLFGNIIMSGTSSFVCYSDHVDTTVTDQGSVSVGFLFGTLTDVPMTEESDITVAFYSGSIQLGVITSSNSESGSIAVSFYTGSLIDQIVSSSVLAESGSQYVSFYTGSLFDSLITSSAPPESGSVAVSFYTGSLYDSFVTASRVRTFESSSVSVGFLSGVLG
jgi:hypothetical protein